jgi:hypothetical protein
MTEPDYLGDTIKIYGKEFDTFTELHLFITKECPEKLMNFQRKYGKCSYHNTLTVF